MATGGNFSGSLSKGSEEIFEFCCTPCSKDGDLTEAVNQCVDCDEFFCSRCTRVHNRLGATSDHKVLDQTDMRKTQGSNHKKPAPPSQKCQTHGGERITTYCGDHDVVCCNTGVAVDHKNCDGIQYIVDAAAGIKSNKRIQTSKTSISSTLKEAKDKKTSRKADRTHLDKEKAANIEQVHDFTERQIHRLRVLETVTVDEITSKYKGLNAGIDRDVASLDEVISTMEGDIQKLDGNNDNQEAQVFVDFKLSQDHEQKGRKLLNQLNNPCKPSLKILLKDNIERELKDLSSLGSFADNSRTYTAKFIGDYNIKVKQDKTTCDIAGSCQLPDGTVMITDRKNVSIKRLDTSFKVTDHCAMQSQPFGVTCTAPGEVAVTLTNKKKVQFVSVGKSLSMTKSFTTSEGCRGITYSAGQLYMTSGGLVKKGIKEDPGHVVIYSLQGARLRKVQTDAYGQRIFTCPVHICASLDEVNVYITDMDNGVKVLDSTGTLVRTITDPSLKYARDLCPLDNGHILVCGKLSNNVLQVNAHSGNVTELLKDTDGINTPNSLHFDWRNSRLIVFNQDTDRIRVFDLK